MKRFDLFGEEGRFYRGNLHTHTTRSDGDYSLEETAAIYKSLGYDFLAVTDHRRYYKAGSSLDGLTLLYGMEADGFINEDKQHVHHFVCLGGDKAAYAHDQTIETELLYTTNAANDLTARLKNSGNLLALAHPNWSRVSFDQIRDLENLWAVEIYNYGCDLENDTGYAHDMWDAYLSMGKRLYAIATDDGHQLHQLGGGWVCAYARENSPSAIYEALAKGRFYASTGPEFKALYIEDGVLHIECTPCQRIMFKTNTLSKNHLSVSSKSRAPITKASYRLSDASDYLRVTIVDDARKMAWSQPIFLEDLR